MTLLRSPEGASGAADGGTDGGDASAATTQSPSGDQQKAGESGEGGGTGTTAVTAPKGQQPSAEGQASSGEGTEVSSSESTQPEAVTAADIKMPEGVEIDQAQMDKFLGVVNDASLTPQARADQLANLHQELVDKAFEDYAKDWIARQKADGEAIKVDPYIGGKNWEQSQTYFAQVLNEFAPPELITEINKTGIGNNIHFAKFLVNVGKAMSEGNPVVGDPTSGEQLTAAQKLYPDQGKT